MSGRVFVDTNILVYAQDFTAGDKHQIAQELVLGLWDSKAGCVSMQVLQEFYVTITRKVARPEETSRAAEMVRLLSTWKVHQPSPQDILMAIDLQQRMRISFWDAMILRSALALDCDVIWSEDLNSGQFYNGLELRNPFLSS